MIVEVNESDVATRIIKVIKSVLSVPEFHIATADGVLKQAVMIKEDLHADSLDSVELTMELEDEFKISIDDNEAEAAKTVAAILVLITRKLQEQT